MACMQTRRTATNRTGCATQALMAEESWLDVQPTIVRWLSAHAASTLTVEVAGAHPTLRFSPAVADHFRPGRDRHLTRRSGVGLLGLFSHPRPRERRRRCSLCGSCWGYGGSPRCSCFVRRGVFIGVTPGHQIEPDSCARGLRDAAARDEEVFLRTLRHRASARTANRRDRRRESLALGRRRGDWRRARRDWAHQKWSVCLSVRVTEAWAQLSLFRRAAHTRCTA